MSDVFFIGDKVEIVRGDYRGKNGEVIYKSKCYQYTEPSYNVRIFGKRGVIVEGLDGMYDLERYLTVAQKKVKCRKLKNIDELEGIIKKLEQELESRKKELKKSKLEYSRKYE